MRGDWQLAKQICIEGLAVDERNEDLAGTLVQALQYDRSITDPLKSIPEGLRSSKAVQLGLLFFQRQRQLAPAWWNHAANMRDLYPDDPFAIQAGAEAIIDRTLKDGGLARHECVTVDNVEQLRRAQADLRDLWEQYSSSQRGLGEAELGLFANLVLCCDLLNDVSVLKILLASAGEEVLSDNEVAVRVAQMAFNKGESTIFEEALNRIKDPRPYFHFSFYLALQKRDWSFLKEQERAVVNLAEPHEREFFALAVEVARLLDFDGEVGTKQLKGLVKDIHEDFRGYLLLLNALEKKGHEESATKLYEQALEKVVQSGERSARYMFAHYAYKKKRDWRAIVQILGGYEENLTDNDELRMLATAHANIIPALKASVDFFEKLPEEVGNLPYYRECAGVFHLNRGALKQASICFKQLIELSTEPTLRLYLPLVSIFQRTQDDEGLKKLLDQMIYLDMQGSGEELAVFSQLLMAQGYLEKAMEVAYQAVADNPDSAHAHQVLAMHVMLKARTDEAHAVIPSVAVVSCDCWVKIERNDGETRELLASSNPDQEARHLFKLVANINEHQIVGLCLGKPVGFDFKLEDGMGIGSSKWTIVGLEHKYAYACRKILEDFDIMFPGTNLLGSMVSGEAGQQLLLKYIKKRTEDQGRLVDIYSSDRVPLAIIASVAGLPTSQMAYDIQTSGKDIVVCHGYDDERKTASELIDTHRMDGVVLDEYTAWTVATMEGFETLNKVFGRLYIPQSCLDTITQMMLETMDRPEGGISVIWKEGQFWKDQPSRTDLEKSRSLFAKVRTDVEAHCEAVPIQCPDEVSPLTQQIIEHMPPSLLDPAFVAAQGKLLLSEDLHFRKFAQRDFNVSGVWLQSVFVFALENGMLEFSEYCRYVVALAHRGHTHLAVNGLILNEVASADGYSLADFDAAANALGTANADIVSHLHVAADGVDLIWGDVTLSRLQKQRFSSIILRKLLRHRQRDWALVVGLMYLNGPLGFRDYVKRWVEGHFLSYEEVSSALRSAYSYHPSLLKAAS